MRCSCLSLLGYVASALLSPGQEDPKRQVEEWKAKLKEAPAAFEKSLVIRVMGESEPKDPALIPLLIGSLAPLPGDPFLYVPTEAVEALGRFRMIPAASKAVLSSLEGYKRIPYLYRKLYLAAGSIGHPTAMPIFDEALGGMDPSQASLAIEAISLMPPGLALEKLFDEHGRMESKRKNAKDNAKHFYDHCQPEIEKAVKTIAAQPYPTFAELKIWWAKHGSGFKQQAEGRKDNAALKVHSPPLIAEFLFKEGAGSVTGNSGASGAVCPQATLTTSRPSWTRTTPPNGGPSALEWDKAPGPHAVDLAGGPLGPEALRNLQSFTITGWFLCTDAKEAPGSKECGAGNRILSWVNPSKLDGVDLVLRADGSLQVGINEWADPSPLRSKAGQVHIYDPKEKDAGAEQFRTWCFFAVTYDSTLEHGQGKVFLGWRQGDAVLSAQADYARGPVGPLIASHLSIGHVPPQIRPQALDRNFRGIIDEIRIVGSPRDGSGALPLPQIIRLQNRGEIP